MSKTNLPHFYKKGKIIKLKNLDDKIEKKEYVFSTTEKTGVIHTVAYQCNNLSQIVTRCLLNTLKINHYFGISKDISQDLSKNKIPFNQFKSDLIFTLKKGGEEKENQFERLFFSIENQNRLILNLTQSIDKHSKHLETLSKNNQFVEEVAKKANIEGILKDNNLRIISIQTQLKQLIG